MEKLRIVKEDIKQDNSGNYKTVYFLDYVRGKDAKNLCSGELYYIEKQLPKYQEFYLNTKFIERCY